MNKVLYVSLADWYWIKQRPHHFCESMSKLNYDVDYLCKKPCRKVGRCMENADNIHDIGIIRTKVLPFESKVNIIKSINNTFMKREVTARLKDNDYKYIIITHPEQLNYFSEQQIKSNKIIYDCMDNYNELFNNPKMQNEIINLEKRLVSISYKVIVSSEKIKQTFLNSYSIEKDKIKVINNGVDLNNFKEEDFQKKPVNARKKIGYIGTVSSWFDCESLIKAAEKLKDVDFSIIGPIIQGCDIADQVKNIPNIKLEGPKDYKEIPKILNSFDVAIMPFKLNKLIESVNPVKIYEYLAMNKPTVATRYKETEKFGELIYLYSSPDEFVTAVEKALLEEEVKPERRKFALGNSWDDRVKEFLEFIQ